MNDTIAKDQRRTPISAIAMLGRLREGWSYPPVRLTLVSESSICDDGQPGHWRCAEYDALVELAWRDRIVRYAVEIKANSRPAVIEQAIQEVQRLAQIAGLQPMLFVPYLSEESLLRLSDNNVSGIDLSGNCVTLGPSVAIWRSGAPNRFPDARSIRDPYSGDSSIVARCLLLRHRFGSLNELREFALARTELDESAGVSILQLGTISKVIRELESEIIVIRDSEGVQTADAGRLLNRLRERYRPAVSRRLLGKTPFSREGIWQRLSDTRDVGGGRYVATGMASASSYGALSGIERLSLYVDDLEATSRAIEVTEGRAFANIELIEARNNLVFFDRRVEGPVVLASPIQTYLELVQDGARERDAAQSLEQLLLHGQMEDQ